MIDQKEFVNMLYTMADISVWKFDAKRFVSSVYSSMVPNNMDNSWNSNNPIEHMPNNYIALQL